MLEFIQRCTTHMQVVLQNQSLDLLRKVDSPRALVHSLSKFGGITQGAVDSPLGRFMKRGNSMSQNIFSFGFGKFFLTSKRQMGYLASLPIVADKEVVQADDEPTFSFSTGPYMSMTNLMWGGSRVTVKELSMKPHQHCSKLRLSDLLLAEQEYSSQLHHPHLLLLMAVCLSNDLEKTRLVFERVNFGSLYSILHERRSEFPVLHMETIVHLLIQVSDALRYLHLRGFIHRTLSSYAVVIVLTGEAKLTNLEHMIESKDGGEHSDLTRVPIPPQLYKWCAPEVILERTATPKSDIYSFCTVMQEAFTDTIPWDGLEGSAVKDLVVSGQWLEADARLPKPYYDIVKTGLESRQKQRTMNLQDIRYVLKNDLKDMLESRRNRPGVEPVCPKTEMHPNINICLPSASALVVKKPEPQEETAHVARSFTMTRCAVSSPEIKPAAVQVSEPVLRMAQSSPILEGRLEDLEEARNANVSLCSVKINEIYTCYPELCEGTERDEEVAGTGDDPDAGGELQDAPGDTAQVASPQAAEIQECEAGLSSDAETECSQEELDGVSTMNEVLRSARSTGGNIQSQFEYKFGKCVLDLKICQTLLQQATDSLSRTEAKLGAMETLGKPRRPFWGTQAREQPAIVIPGRGCQEKLEAILRNISAPLNGDRALQWKAVAPPMEAYVSPPFRIPGTYRPLVVHSYQAAENRPKSGIQSQDTTYWSDFGLEAAKSPLNQRGTEPNYQLLHPGVSFRRKKSPHLRRGSSMLEGIKVAEGSLEKTAPENYGANLRREERRMAQCEWTTEVKQMAKKVASGQLGFPAQHPASRWMLESEAEDTFPIPANRDRVRFCQENGEVGKGQPSRAIGDHKVLSDHEKGRNLDSPLGRAAGREKQGKCSPIPAGEGGAASHNHVCRSLTTEDSCREQPEDPTHSPSSSLNVSEEFLTPDPDYFFGGSAPHDHSELEYSTAEEEEEEDTLEITEEICGQKEQLKQSQVNCGQKEHPIDARQRREFSCGTGTKYIHDDVPRRERFTPAISPGTAQGRSLGEAARELKEEDPSLADIQDLSSISCKDSCKTSALKTPRSTNSPIKASTPLSPVDPAPKFSSTVTKYKDYCVMTIDTSCWATHDVSLLGLSTFPAACAKGVTTEVAPAPQHPSAGLLEPARNLWLPLLRGQAESGREFPSAQHKHPQKGAPDRLDSKDQGKPAEKTPNVSTAEDSLWFSDSACLGEDTERAHSSFDKVLEEVICPIADSHDLNKGLPDAIQRGKPSCAHHGNIEMKGGAEESFSESEGSIENVEGLS